MSVFNLTDPRLQSYLMTCLFCPLPHPAPHQHPQTHSSTLAPALQLRRGKGAREEEEAVQPSSPAASCQPAARSTCLGSDAEVCVD